MEVLLFFCCILASVIFNEFTYHLKAILQKELPGQEAQYLMAASHIRNKKIDLEMLNGYKKSAVCLLFYPNQKEICFILTKRPQTFQHHAGQIALPGGACDADESYEQTALRELYEETHALVVPEQIVGRLTPLYIPISNFYIQPIVACTDQKPKFIANAQEVDVLIECTLSYLLQESIVKETTLRTSSGLHIKTPYFDVQENILWGATAMLLSEIKQLFLREKTTFSSLFR
ncbi:MAG: CoA pyrophosphatase [Bacteroidetes bacterium]|nr:CoA pyrophosphatase [Bacteroidota bacterium]